MEKRTKNVDLFCSRCGKHIFPEHSDIVYINCDKFDITVAIVIIFVCVYLQVCSRFVLLASVFEVYVVIPVYLQVVWWFV